MNGIFITFEGTDASGKTITISVPDKATMEANLGKTADQVLKEWDSMELTDFIYDMYEIYHVERLQNAFDDIDELIMEHKENLGMA